MKAYTDIEQSKKLVEILPLESADMEYMFLKEDNSKVSNIPFVKDDEEPEWPNDSAYDFIPCWSLAALLDILDFPSLTQNKEDEWEVCVPNCESDEYIEVSAVNPVDACYEMILKLNGLNLL